MAFAFRLERVLSVRRLQEDTAQVRHSEALERRLRAEEKLAGVEGELIQCLEALDDLKRRDELTAEHLYFHSLHSSGLRRAIQTARADLQRCSREVDRTAAELLEAHRAREALEKLREREYEVWRRDQSRREAKQLDEVAVSRRRSREEENHGP